MALAPGALWELDQRSNILQDRQDGSSKSTIIRLN